MSKCIVKTTGNFSLYNPNGLVLHRKRPTLTAKDVFMQQQVALKRLEIVEDGIADEATDEEFAKYWAEADGDVEFACQSFKSSFLAPAGSQYSEPKPDAPKPATRRRASK